MSEQVSLVRAVRYTCTCTGGHCESGIQGRVVYHGLKVGGTQSFFPLFAVFGIVFGIVFEIVFGTVNGIGFGIVEGVVDEVLRRADVAVVALCGSAVHVAWTHAPRSFDSQTTAFAIMTNLLNPQTTRSARTLCHALSCTTHSRECRMCVLYCSSPFYTRRDQKHKFRVQIT